MEPYVAFPSHILKSSFLSNNLDADTVADNIIALKDTKPYYSVLCLLFIDYVYANRIQNPTYAVWLKGPKDLFNYLDSVDDPKFFIKRLIETSRSMANSKVREYNINLEKIWNPFFNFEFSLISIESLPVTRIRKDLFKTFMGKFYDDANPSITDEDRIDLCLSKIDILKVTRPDVYADIIAEMFRDYYKVNMARESIGQIDSLYSFMKFAITDKASAVSLYEDLEHDDRVNLFKVYLYFNCNYDEANIAVRETIRRDEEMSQKVKSFNKTLEFK